eukprot:TRINITY_DN915_c0_g2_i10.p1 TRINITY_DN915_c0_g2~~TRINITY_DN915_c0_g2_i10.p1  ORF type:complete len:795 (-),score=211.45 TRINITY_DN915_c0_g2_i10:231-2615(-)
MACHGSVWFNEDHLSEHSFSKEIPPFAPPILHHYMDVIPKLLNRENCRMAHPKVVMKLHSYLEDKKLSWEYLHRDNFLTYIFHIATPVYLACDVLDQLAWSGMCLNPHIHLQDSLQIFYEDLWDKNTKRQLDLLPWESFKYTRSFNAHSWEFKGKCSCLQCFINRNRHIIKHHAWAKFTSALGDDKGIFLPSLKACFFDIGSMEYWNEIGKEHYWKENPEMRSRLLLKGSTVEDRIGYALRSELSSQRNGLLQQIDMLRAADKLHRYRKWIPFEGSNEAQEAEDKGEYVCDLAMVHDPVCFNPAAGAIQDALCMLLVSMVQKKDLTDQDGLRLRQLLSGCSEHEFADRRLMNEGIIDWIRHGRQGPQPFPFAPSSNSINVSNAGLDLMTPKETQEISALVLKTCIKECGMTMKEFLSIWSDSSEDEMDIDDKEENNNSKEESKLEESKEIEEDHQDREMKHTKELNENMSQMSVSEVSEKSILPPPKKKKVTPPIPTTITNNKRRRPMRSCRKTEVNYSKFFDESSASSVPSSREVSSSSEASENEYDDDISDIDSDENVSLDEDDILDDLMDHFTEELTSHLNRLQCACLANEPRTDASDNTVNRTRRISSNNDESNVPPPTTDIQLSKQLKKQKTCKRSTTRRKRKDPLEGIEVEEAVEGSRMTVDEAHKKLDSFPKIKKCPECGNNFNSLAEMKIHYAALHIGLRYCCPQESCEYRATQKGHLPRHIRIVHEKEKNYECECGKKCSEKGNLRKHIERVHKDEREHECKECGKKFGQKSNLQTHIKRVHQGS